MSKPTLFICKNCHATKVADSEIPQGTRLLNRLKKINTDSSFVVKGEGCLWICEQACVAAISATDRHTYLFSNLPLEGTAEALLEFANLYVNHKNKSIPIKKFPEVLDSATIACIPPIERD